MSRIKDALKPAYHAVRDAAVRAEDAHGARLSARSETDYRKVVLSCNFGRGYLCNPKYIAEALERLYPGEFDIVLLVKHRDDGLPPYLRQVRYGSREAQRELATARFWIYNFRNDAKHVPKRGDQVYIQTWHAALGPKRVEADAAEHLSAGYVAAAQYDGSITDLMFANSDLYERMYHESFWYNGPVMRCGVPRNRPLVLGDPEMASRARAWLNVPEGHGICLFAPTFRADGSMDAYRFGYGAVEWALEERFSRPFTLAYRLHPGLADAERPDFLRGVLDATAYPDQQDLLAASDVVISDYSSILEDFAMTGRPGFVFASDIDNYADDRGFVYPLESRPFPVATTSDALVKNVKSFDEAAYRSSLDDFFQCIGLVDDGHGDERVAEVMHALTAPGSTVRDVLSARKAPTRQE